MHPQGFPWIKYLTTDSLLITLFCLPCHIFNFNLGYIFVQAVVNDIDTGSRSVDLDKNSENDPACSASNSASEDEDENKSCSRPSYKNAHYTLCTCGYVLHIIKYKVFLC